MRSLSLSFKKKTNRCYETKQNNVKQMKKKFLKKNENEYRASVENVKIVKKRFLQTVWRPSAVLFIHETLRSYKPRRRLDTHKRRRVDRLVLGHVECKTRCEDIGGELIDQDFFERSAFNILIATVG